MKIRNYINVIFWGGLPAGRPAGSPGSLRGLFGPQKMAGSAGVMPRLEAVAKLNNQQGILGGANNLEILKS